jgi:CubicO group peptidase (beta-lactamase class C family)
MTGPDFGALHAAMRKHVDDQLIPCVSTALLRGRETVDVFCYGFADREAVVPLRDDHVFRVFSNTKLVTSCAVMLLVEDGRIALDDPIEAYLPELGSLQVLDSGATRIDDTEPAASAITIRQLMTHTSGLSSFLSDAGSPLVVAYAELGVSNPSVSLAETTKKLGQLPLSFQPGTQWKYSLGTDVLGRLVEVISAKSFGEVLSSRIFEPLAMVDTDFWVPEAKRDRLCALYVGADLTDPMKLKEETIAEMNRNQLPGDLCVQFPNMPRFENQRFGLGSAVMTGPVPGQPDQAVGEVGWGGLAGTAWWINPQIGIAAVLMTQRYFGHGHPYTLEFKREAYRALGFGA